MESNYLEAVGFLADWQATYDLLTPPAMMGLPRNDQFNHIVVYPDDSGANICLFETADGTSSQSLTVAGPARVSVEGWQVVPGVAHLSVLDDDGEEMTRLLMWVDDPNMYPVYGIDADGPVARYGDYRVGAIAVDVEVFDSEEDWEKAQTPISMKDSPAKRMDEDLPDEVYIGPRFVASPWLFALYSGEAGPEDVSPIGMLKAVCNEVTIVTNRLTGNQWYKVNADCGFPITLGLPIGTTPAPHPGSVVDGKAFLTGTTGFWLADYEDPYA
ncbi:MULTISPECIES: hypothetical protein [unclassified Actinomyces]|uniref:hypothetical protein n=1 Tax=unclassified Actinomyces TaxID=2609248 RepID=UPI000D59844C|nr:MULTISPECIES: hypothetical protein [unclassified Actinomyces]RAX23501.1 hypothetical protein DRB06_02460 [Actinomyces sp. Z5]RAX23840.1 hypothetical protein DRB07_02780 [Actinomyces sp. Z3]